MIETISIGSLYEYEFAGQEKTGILLEIKTLYDGTEVYVFKSKENNRVYPVLKQKIKNHVS